MTVKQLSVFVENKLGRLVKITSVLAQNNIDIKAISVADTTGFGILRLIVSDLNLAESALKEAGFTVSQTEVLAIGIEDKPGELSAALSALSENGISVEYIYAFVSREEKTAFVIMHVNDNDKASDVLEKQGVKLLSSEDIENI